MIIHINRYFVAFLILTVSLDCAHAELFVSPTGSDISGDGSIDNPFASAHAAVAAASSNGEVITIRKTEEDRRGQRRTEEDRGDRGDREPQQHP